MPRKGHVAKRDVLPDPIYHSKVVTRFINQIMIDGKRGKAATILYKAFEMIQEETGRSPMEVFEEAVENVAPVLETKSRRVGGANYQVPVEVRPERRQTLALRWLVAAARERGEGEMIVRLAREVMDAANNTGAAVRRREMAHQMAEANKAFAHFRW